MLSNNAQRSEFLARTTKTALALRLFGSVWFLGMLVDGMTMLPSSHGVCSDAHPGAPALGWYSVELSDGLLPLFGKILAMEVWWEYVEEVTVRSK